MPPGVVIFPGGVGRNCRPAVYNSCRDFGYGRHSSPSRTGSFVCGLRGAEISTPDPGWSVRGHSGRRKFAWHVLCAASDDARFGLIFPKRNYGKWASLGRNGSARCRLGRIRSSCRLVIRGIEQNKGGALLAHSFIKGDAGGTV